MRSLGSSMPARRVCVVGASSCSAATAYRQPMPSLLGTEVLIRLRPKSERPSIAALALTLDPAMLTACGNDYGYDRVFERPLRGLGRRGDVLFGITTSGRSPNVVRALAAAREMGIVTVGMLGGAGEPALGQCDLV